jgi:hypothetical protein
VAETSYAACGDKRKAPGVDTAGNAYVTDGNHHRLLRFAAG